MPRFQKHIFICTNERKSDDARGCCVSRGSLELLDYLKGRVHDLGLKKNVRVNKAGCIDACAQGPSMVVYPDDIWYAPRTQEDMEEILTEHIQNNRPVARLVIPFKKNP
ncbi:MAG: (2Fe-2S) ferredoxin domain-containing protein [Nitrospinaceae bacterium]|jgi:(2Fe-2S) ferredoxin|nr:(2Fe-2S) ferredoxin domain-containing protein [Nitrospina sp.]MBT5869742.1 (2Fe-2S) ferredoxin domain-containing protein [Nitrospinaceae bacterium]